MPRSRLVWLAPPAMDRSRGGAPPWRNGSIAHAGVGGRRPTLTPTPPHAAGPRRRPITRSGGAHAARSGAAGLPGANCPLAHSRAPDRSLRVRGSRQLTGHRRHGPAGRSIRVSSAHELTARGAMGARSGDSRRMPARRPPGHPSAHPPAPRPPRVRRASEGGHGTPYRARESYAHWSSAWRWRGRHAASPGSQCFSIWATWRRMARQRLICRSSSGPRRPM
jgi:hypothetical protein